MKNRPRIGLTGELAFQIEPKHAIDFATGGMPAVLSTPSLVGFLERTAREAMAGCLDDDERSVGHTVHCTARVIHTEDREVTFQISARDEREVIARGLHKRAVIRVDHFASRVKAKSA